MTIEHIGTRKKLRPIQILDCRRNTLKFDCFRFARTDKSYDIGHGMSGNNINRFVFVSPG